MTKRDFELIAQALRIAAYEARHNGADASDGVQIATEAIAVRLADDNPRFMPARFLAACRTSEEAK
jgi:hypothetical protein